ncbi:hypothetical protein JL722_1928 [Aureococcus anophagefferens]|nr:hypothetical protein JL722_1928 [Aureococcus anophagefferens]
MAADDIMAFMTRVKRKLVDDDAQYATFVRALHRWEQQAIGTDELEASVTSLLADDEGLLRDFARLFAPRAPGGPARAAAAPADVDAAVAYLRDVEARVGDEARYGEFLALLRLWEAGRVEIDALVRDVSRLLGGDAGLRAGQESEIPNFKASYLGREAALLERVLMAESAATRPRGARAVAAAVFGAESPATRAYRGRVGARYAGPLAAALENSPFAEYQVSAEAFRALHAQLARPAGGADERLRLERDAAGAGAGHE